MFLRSLYISLLTALAAANANASDFYAGIYLGAADHESKFDVANEDLDPDQGFDFQKQFKAPDDSEKMAGIVLGYKLGKDVSLELGYSGIETYEGDERSFTLVPVDPDNPAVDPTTDLRAAEEVEIDFVTISIVGEWPVHQRWAIHGKIGFSSWDYKYKQVLTDHEEILDTNNNVIGIDEVPYRSESFSDSGTDLIYGLGIAYAINQTFELRLDVEIHSFEPQFTNTKVETDLTNVAFGVIAHF